MNGAVQPPTSPPPGLAVEDTAPSSANKFARCSSLKTQSDRNHGINSAEKKTASKRLSGLLSAGMRDIFNNFGGRANGRRRILNGSGDMQTTPTEPQHWRSVSVRSAR
eukprot:gnl/MRDRNA2_/MRDRNA2_593729_c0_seq1.p1 gnl/MRDRNA2_/MRDRNA2_593729_c0~~gnl/MRDRNA2_/MRDRNA2_593729_c0_seq1.p1  ORF type:complete len:116 (+),score=18.58 gnl/MRDRNA2_/MRDRNA2_593729_c0_seq1:25-348(+)